MSPRSARKQRWGFTLVELLVVVGIIAILIAILLPALKKVKEQANSIKCMAGQRQIMAAVLMYAAEMKNSIPMAPGINETYPGGSPEQKSLGYFMSSQNGGLAVIRYDVGIFWTYLLRGANKGGGGVGTEKPGPEALQSIMNCPSDRMLDYREVQLGGTQLAAGKRRNFSYSWNSHIRLMQTGGFHLPGDPSPDVVHKMSQVKTPSHKILLIEELAPNDGQCWIMLNDPDDEPAFRHNFKANYGFADGHVQSMDPVEMGFSTVRKDKDHAIIRDMRKCRYYFKLNSNVGANP